MLKVSVSVSSGGVSASLVKYSGGSVAMLESKRLCSLSIWVVGARIFSVSGSFGFVGTIVGSGSRLFSKVDVTVMKRVFLMVPTYEGKGRLWYFIRV